MAKRTATKKRCKPATSKTKGARKAGSAATKSKKSTAGAGRSNAAGKKAAVRGTTPPKRRTARSTRSTIATPKPATKAVAEKRTNRRKAKKTPRTNKTPPSVASPSATSQDPIQFPEQSRPLPKTRLTDKELAEFNTLLVVKRRELAGDVRRLTDEALNTRSQGSADHSSMPIHMADLGSDNWEQEFTLGLIANEEALVREIDDALVRIENRTYGVCLATRKRISKARLRAKPWAKYCIEYARARDEGRAP